MPVGEIEYHPYLERGRIPNASRMILGSFPVYECTGPDNAAKRARREEEGTICFFYGSVDNAFWSLYGRYVDGNILPECNPEILLASLTERRIAMSDLISSCQRHGYSSEDGKLLSKLWNRKGIRNLDGFAVIEEKAAIEFHHDLVEEVGGDPALITGRIASIFSINGNDDTHEAVAIPSPGSPQRQLRQFGFGGYDCREYANEYYKAIFHWFLQ
jgi:hypothetical protein